MIECALDLESVGATETMIQHFHSQRDIGRTIRDEMRGKAGAPMDATCMLDPRTLYLHRATYDISAGDFGRHAYLEKPIPKP